jgi:signal peptidase I
MSQVASRSIILPLLVSGMLMLLVAAWATLAPSRLGGPLTVVVTSGASMAPDIETGDLVLIRRTPDPRVGDVVAYHSARMGHTVLHRIVDRDHEGRFVLQGDANAWLDPERVTPNEVIGRQWLHIPRAGRMISWLGSPAGLGLTGILAASLVIAAVTTGGNPRPQQHGRVAGLRRTGRSGAERLLDFADSATGGTALGALLGLTVAAALAGAVLWSMAPTRTSVTPVSYSHSGTFSFSAPVTVGPEVLAELNLPPEVIDRLLAPTREGDPIFLNLSPEANTGFVYSFASPGAVELRGEIALAGSVREASGWGWTDEILRVPFEGQAASFEITLPLQPAMDQIAAFELLTGRPGRDYTAIFGASVQVSGTIDGVPFEDTFTPHLTLRMVPPNEFIIDTRVADLSDLLLAVGDASRLNPFLTVEHGAVEAQREVDRTVPVGPLDVSVATLRWAATALVVAAAMLVAGLYAAAVIASRRPKQERIASLFGARLVQTAQTGAQRPADVVVTSLDDFVRLVAQTVGPVLWWDESGRYVYEVTANGSRCQYRTTG